MYRDMVLQDVISHVMEQGFNYSKKWIKALPFVETSFIMSIMSENTSRIKQKFINAYKDEMEVL